MGSSLEKVTQQTWMMRVSWPVRMYSMKNTALHLSLPAGVHFIVQNETPQTVCTSTLDLNHGEWTSRFHPQTLPNSNNQATVSIPFLFTL